MPDHHHILAERIANAYHEQRQIKIEGQQSKSFLALNCEAEAISTLEHNDIISYEPSELVVTVRSGTRITDLQSVLARYQQTLAFDPPCFDNKGTIGGTIAVGLSGPARAWTGAARDFVLGTRVINGKGEVLKFGGQVMKNVAGYDASRLMTGAYGTLGLILDLSIKVLPIPEHTVTLVQELSADQAIELTNGLSGKPLPITGTCWINNRLYIRMAGSEASLSAAAATIGGEIYEDAEFWNTIRDQQHDFFTHSYWRLAVPPATPMPPLKGQWLIEWGGAQRWLHTEELPHTISQAAHDAGGHAEQWKHPDQEFLRPELDPGLNKYHQRLKDVFDPGRILNQGILYPDL
jgi:glycolate oxidase FAD binding subunit